MRRRSSRPVLVALVVTLLSGPAAAPAAANSIFAPGFGGTGFSSSDRDTEAAGDTLALALDPYGGGVLTIEGVGSFIHAYVFDASGHQRLRFNTPAGAQITADATGVIDVATARGRISRYDRRGRLVGSFATGLSPAAVAADRSGQIYVASGRQVVAFAPTRAHGVTLDLGPGGVASGLAPDMSGDLYVSDAGNPRVDEFRASGGLVRTIGGPAEADGALSQPGGVGVDASGDLLVVNAPAAGAGVRLFSPDGHYEGPFQQALLAPAADPFSPVLLAVAPSGDVYLTDQNPDITKVPAALMRAPSFRVLDPGLVSAGDLEPRLVTVGHTLALPIEVYPSPASGLRAAVAAHPAASLTVSSGAVAGAPPPAAGTSPVGWTLHAGTRAGAFDAAVTVAGLASGGVAVAETKHVPVYVLPRLHAHVAAAVYSPRDGTVTVALDVGRQLRAFGRRSMFFLEAIGERFSPSVTVRLGGHPLVAEAFSEGDIASGMCQSFVVPRRLRRAGPLRLRVGVTDPARDPTLAPITGHGRVTARRSTRNATLKACAYARSLATGAVHPPGPRRR